MQLLEDLIEDLSADVFVEEQRSGSTELAEAIARMIGDSSTVMEEAFQTAMRYRRADARARALLAQRRTPG